MTQREGTLDCSHCQKFNTVSHSHTHTLSSFLPSTNSLTPSLTLSMQTVSFTPYPSFSPITLKSSCLNHNPFLPYFVLQHLTHIKLLHILHHHSFLPFSFTLLASHSLQISSSSPHSYQTITLITPSFFPFSHLSPSSLTHSQHHLGYIQFANFPVRLALLPLY